MSKKTQMRKAYSLIELILAMVIIGILIGIVYSTFKKTDMPAKADREAARIETVRAAIERSREYNSDTYPVYSGQITASTNLKNALGGTVAVKDLAGWQYNCARSSSTTVSFTTTAYDSTEMRSLIISKLRDRIAPWTVANSGAGLVISKPAAVCQ